MSHSINPTNPDYYIKDRFLDKVILVTGAAIILFLLSDDASNITGASYATDGGWTTY